MRAVGGAEGLTEMAFHHFCHQPVGGAPHRHNLLEQRGAIRSGLDRAFKRFRLPLDATQACYGPLLLFWGGVSTLSCALRRADTSNFGRSEPEPSPTPPETSNARPGFLPP
ncbi:hypothetical protein WR25_06516 [Diploscapter pachys]|uniref:Uncharacterized protein n=1 Tax=Diploscapter pachys TaxID=2018661 RepID=A0A2A2JX95_9BILA|nr:hypothetical protein WR25_06516 [Diploscapter pachys]